VLILFTLLVIDFLAGNKIYAKPNPNALAIRVRGHQWWWEVEYSNPTPSEIMTTANEIHVPVGRPVKLELESTDVIHSFWVPNTHDNMVRWIRNPQKIKPGTQMPPSDFSDDDLNALAAYMESLK